MPTRNQMLLHVDFARPEGSKLPIYYIGPFGARVSFKSQQNRALNVVGSLIELKHIRLGEKIVVVGAGLAGVTATLALALRGHDVHLYEAGDGVFALQANSSHRYVHPSVNFWPIEDADRTTLLPFLDWYSATAQRVVETLRRQWRAGYEEEARERDLEEIPGLRDLLPNKPVFDRRLKFESYTPASGVTLSVEGRSEKVQAKHVLVAVGFGVEANLDDARQKTYWEHDSLDDIVEGPGGYDILVSGTGDGGLIDCLRLAFRDFRAGDFPLEVIAKAERGAAPRLREQLTAIEEGIGAYDTPQAIAAYLAAAYDALVDDLPPTFEAWLYSRLNRNPRGKPANRVRLLGVFGAPFETTAAAINRFLIAFALKREAVTFLPGAIGRSGGRYMVELDAGGTEDIPETTRVIIRHGPRHALDGFLETEDEVKALKAHQMTARAYGAEGHFPQAYFFEKSIRYPCRTRNLPAYALTRNFLAFEFLLERFGVLTDLVTDGEVGFEVWRPEALREEREVLARLPPEIFDVPVRRVDPPTGPATLAVGRRPSR